MITVAIGHQEPFVRQNLRAVLERTATCKVVGEASDGRAALALCQRYKPAIVLLESSIPGVSAVEVARSIQQDHLPAKVLILASDRGDWNMADFIQAGIAGYVASNASHDQLLHAVEVVARGGLWFNAQLFACSHHSGQLSSLTPRELDVLRLLAKGLRSNQIADRLVVSKYTVGHHITSIYGKLGTTNRAEATAYAIRHGLVITDECLKHEK